MSFDGILSTFGLNKIKTGEIVGKRYYGPTSIAVPTVSLGGLGTTTETVESWSVIVKGKGVFGKVIEQEMHIDSLPGCSSRSVTRGPSSVPFSSHLPNWHVCSSMEYTT